MATDRLINPPTSQTRKIWKRYEVWAIIVFVLLCGAVAGSTISRYFTLKEANKRYAELSLAYNEASDARNETLRICLSQTQGAANNAASAASEAATAATAAQQAADKAVKAVKESPK